MNDYLQWILCEQQKVSFQNLELARTNQYMLKSLEEHDRHPIRFALERVLEVHGYVGICCWYCYYDQYINRLAGVHYEAQRLQEPFVQR